MSGEPAVGRHPALIGAVDLQGKSLAEHARAARDPAVGRMFVHGHEHEVE
jgi:hypothetical protein